MVFISSSIPLLAGIFIIFIIIHFNVLIFRLVNNHTSVLVIYIQKPDTSFCCALTLALDVKYGIVDKSTTFPPFTLPFSPELGKRCPLKVTRNGG